ncbi:uncharacterized protein LOC123676860 [Harmonia axyridis]|uniref:uncharacterized protein LOC123676860 n=1 Tax=Harmonia axyridis TaxID=115357 RepID=UPI001E2762D7|nr:uncharacterized protein LOC123676860 [Harmonia axyridis]XP_045469072.1 uncharacterized protein LOC123676860 [Harmonia axyridis]
MDGNTFMKTLTNWGLEAYVGRFIDEGIDDSSFMLLDDETINKIFDKAGPKLIFKNKFNENKENFGNNLDKSLQEFNSEKIDEACQSQNKTLYSYSITNLLSPSSCSTSTISNVVSYEPDEELLSILEDSDNCSSSSTPKRGRFESKSSIFSKSSLEELLKTSTDGKLILLHRRKLCNDLRQKLCKIIINDLFSSSYCLSPEIKKSIFETAAEDIVALFPSEEKETYYIPYSSSSKAGIRQAARGKLWSKYINVKAALRLANKSLVVKELPSTPCEPSVVTDPEVSTALSFLRAGIEPKVKVISAWESTVKVRIKQYSDPQSDNPFDIFPCLRSPYGLELLESDFHFSYPEKVDVIYLNWDKITTAILEEVKERKIELIPSKDKNTQAFLTLPFLFSPVTMKKNSKDLTKNWRPTRVEVQNSFFFQVKTIDEINEICERRKLLLEKFGVPMQPFSTYLEEENIYVISINGNRFKCESCVRTIELLFKAIHALNLEYAAESKHIWQFIEEMLFQMPVLGKTSSTSAVIGDIKLHLNK